MNQSTVFYFDPKKESKVFCFFQNRTLLQTCDDYTFWSKYYTQSASFCVISGLCIQISKTINFIYFLYKTQLHIYLTIFQPIKNKLQNKINNICIKNRKRQIKYWLKSFKFFYLRDLVLFGLSCLCIKRSNIIELFSRFATIIQVNSNKSHKINHIRKRNKMFIVWS